MTDLVQGGKYISINRSEAERKTFINGYVNHGDK